MQLVARACSAPLAFERCDCIYLGKRTQSGPGRGRRYPTDHLAVRRSGRPGKWVASRRRFAVLEDRSTDHRQVAVGHWTGQWGTKPVGGTGQTPEGQASMRNRFFAEPDGRSTWRVVDRVTGLGVADGLGAAFRDLSSREAQQIVRDLELGQAAGPLPSYVAGDLLCVDRDQWVLGPWNAGPGPGPD